ncbi:MAG: hypothetical protein VX341_13120 [Bdellovibrionota bacterium]|nr:hypothetical protein [Bdellovibrionota bacterium]
MGILTKIAIFILLLIGFNLDSPQKVKPRTLSMNFRSLSSSSFEALSCTKAVEGILSRENNKIDHLIDEWERYLSSELIDRVKNMQLQLTHDNDKKMQLIKELGNEFYQIFHSRLDINRPQLTHDISDEDLLKWSPEELYNFFNTNIDEEYILYRELNDRLLMLIKDSQADLAAKYNLKRHENTLSPTPSYSIEIGSNTLRVSSAKWFQTSFPLPNKESIERLPMTNELRRMSNIKTYIHITAEDTEDHLQTILNIAKKHNAKSAKWAANSQTLERADRFVIYFNPTFTSSDKISLFLKDIENELKKRNISETKGFNLLPKFGKYTSLGVDYRGPGFNDNSFHSRLTQALAHIIIDGCNDLRCKKTIFNNYGFNYPELTPLELHHLF